MPSIRITGSDTTTGDLTLSPSGAVGANKSQIVTWIINPNSGVSSIKEIKNKTTSVDVFNPDPAPVGGGSTNWQGTINPNLTIPDPPPLTEDYNIVWYDEKNPPEEHTFDPKISVNR
ncbi:hypothetical protein [uncultured Eudoraea sp.]|jgi:hypothetical protein|uniref:hypothetical protein n=1 Tax=uncultured Eudoraea sp. TaxID=1035614 RepID=UPI00260CDDA1|nr:hypothetical protein [uncultured Eudoraea sp.]